MVLNSKKRDIQGRKQNVVTGFGNLFKVLGSQRGRAYLCCENRSPLSINLPRLKFPVTRVHSERLVNMSRIDCFPAVILVVVVVVVVIVVVVAVVFQALGPVSFRKMFDS